MSKSWNKLCSTAPNKPYDPPITSSECDMMMEIWQELSFACKELEEVTGGLPSSMYNALFLLNPGRVSTLAEWSARVCDCLLISSVGDSTSTKNTPQPIR